MPRRAKPVSAAKLARAIETLRNPGGGTTMTHGFVQPRTAEPTTGVLMSGKEAAALYDEAERSWSRCAEREGLDDGDRMAAKEARSALAVAASQRMRCVVAARQVREPTSFSDPEGEAWSAGWRACRMAILNALADGDT